MTPLDRVCDILDEHSVRYALIGAAALAAYGVARSTFDIDLLTNDRRVLDHDVWSRLGGAVDVRIGDVEDPLAGVVRYAEAGERPIDVVVGKQAWQARAVERARSTGDRIPIVEARDLVLLKLYAGGTQDLWDIRELLQHASPALGAEVSADLEGLATELRQRWDAVSAGHP